MYKIEAINDGIEKCLELKKIFETLKKTAIKKIFLCKMRRTSDEKLQYTIYKGTMDALMSKLTFGLLY